MSRDEVSARERASDGETPASATGAQDHALAPMPSDEGERSTHDGRSSDTLAAGPSSGTAPRSAGNAAQAFGVLSRPFVRDVGGVLAAWFVLFTAENLITTRARPAGYRLGDLVATELHVVPMALALAIPFAAGVVWLGRLVAARKSLLVATVAAAVAGAVAYGISTGRHMQNPAVRSAFVAAMVALGFGGTYVAVKKLSFDRAFRIAAGGAGLACAAWLCDAFVLRQLYPAFHTALFALTLLCAAVVWTALRNARVAPKLSFAGLALGAASWAWIPGAVRAIADDEPLRETLLAAAPILGRTTAFSMRFAPKAPPPTDDTEEKIAAVMTFSEQPRTLDWSGKDILLVTIDALRADHLGTYGYARRTSPNIDALAARGVRFDRAYSPISNTSYSITSLMTGKYMHPLLTGDVEGADRAETWASHLQRMGYATGGIFPPAVFYVDTHQFRFFEETAYGFAHREESYAEPPKRRDDVAQFLATVPADKPAFVWVHIFEPHEPYVMHPDFPFEGNRPVDAYDSEIAASDALVGEIVKLVDARHRGPVVILTADHGEAFGEHGSNYHNSDVYEEQVRVPLIVVGPGVAPGTHVAEPVQTIDLLATTLSALGARRPPELRGRDLGRLLAAKTDDATPPSERGFAYAEAGQQTMVAQGSERLLCVRDVQTCALFDLTTDPLQQTSLRDREARSVFLKLVTAAVERENTKGTAEVEDEVAAAMALDTDTLVARLSEPEPSVRLAAALALANRRDARGVPELMRRWESSFTPNTTKRGPVGEARDVLAGLAAVRAKEAVPTLVRALDDVTLRGSVVKALQAIGDPSAKDALLAALKDEPYADLRSAELQALLALGVREELGEPLARFATLPDPMFDAIQFAERANVLRPDNGGIAFPSGTANVDAELDVKGTGPTRLLVRTFSSNGKLSARVDGVELPLSPTLLQLWTADLPTEPKENAKVRVELQRKSGIRAVWLVRVAEAPRVADEAEASAPPP